VYRQTASPQMFRGTDRLKFTSAEQARIRVAEERHGYRRQQEPQVRRSGGLGTALGALIVWLLLECLVCALTAYTHSNFAPSHRAQPNTKSVQVRSSVPRSRLTLRDTTIEKSPARVVATSPIMPEIREHGGIVVKRPEQSEATSSDARGGVVITSPDDAFRAERVEAQRDPKASTDAR
jgi:hypothetical protein